MGKQINYYMEYESFVKLCEKALSIGFELVKEDTVSGRVITSSNTDILTDESGNRYYFHLPEAGELEITTNGKGRDSLKRGYTACSNAIIEAGFSRIFNGGDKYILSARLFSQTGYYDSDGNFIARPECMEKKYNAMVRFVKKLAPYTELTRTIISTKEEDYMKEYEQKYKVYITPYCLDFVKNKSYKTR